MMKTTASPKRLKRKSVFIFDLLIRLPSLELWQYHQSHSPHKELQSQFIVDDAIQSNLSEVQESLFEILNCLGETNFSIQASRRRYFYSHGVGKMLPTAYSGEDDHLFWLNVITHSART
jgi:hypothetical protein